MDPFIAQIIMFGGNFAPRGWAFCEGQLLPISSHTALFSILGTTYGGDGRTTFALPDLRGRIPIQQGTGPGLSSVALGQRGGTETHALTVAEMPAHAHDGSSLGGTSTMPCADDDGISNDASGNVLATASSGTPFTNAAADSTLASPGAVSITGNTGSQGSGQAFSTRDPYLGVNYIIALQGIYPSRS